MAVVQTDVLVVGSGLAGLRYALGIADAARVTVLTKRDIDEGNTRYAQGGIAAAWDDKDSWAAHELDTLVAGAGLCRREVVARTVKEAKDRVTELIDFGVSFDRRNDRPEEYDLHQEGGHSARRILHTKDLTGAEVMRALTARVAAHPNISVIEDAIAIDLITAGWLARRQEDLPPHPDRVLGAYVLDTTTNQVTTYQAKVVALCTGGAGKVYLYTSNPDVASGDGIAMAFRAGARVANMEFVQFHPTCLFHPEARNFLISEALRGEGGILRLQDGDAFMARYDKRKELAPRDIVARAIDAELKRTGHDSVFLDMTHLDSNEVIEKFPNIHATCLTFGIDITAAPIPVVPAAHYFCGGVVTDANAETNISNLFAIGETSCTGLHGANRLASNSLLEATSYAHHASLETLARLPEIEVGPVLPDWDPGTSSRPDEAVIIKQVWDEIRRFMWNYVGIVRSNRRLMRARKRIDLVQGEIEHYYWDFQVTSDLIELRNIATVAQCVVDCALQRRESRGLHFNLDYPESDERFVRDSVVERRF